MIDGEDLPTGEPEFINGTAGEEAPAPEPEAREPEKAEPEAEAKPDEPEHPEKAEEDDKPKQTPWFQKRIDELTRARYEEQRRREALEAELARVRQPADGEKPADRPMTQAEIDRLVEERAAQKAAASEFNRACDKTFEDGVKSYHDFEKSLASFRMLGGLPPALVEAALETGEPAKVLYELGKDPDEASRVMGLSGTKMAVAVAKIAVRAAAPTVAPVSKAPPPIRPIAANGKAELPPEKMSMAEWEKKFPLPVR